MTITKALLLRLSAASVLFSLFTFAMLSIPPGVSAAVQYTFYASPVGSGSDCSQVVPCSLTGARDKVRTVNSGMSGDIVVYLRGGTYALSSTLLFNSADSGTNGYNVIYQAFGGEIPVLSGGTAISGWSLFDTSRNIYRVNVGTSFQTRQLYVTDQRATRARGSTNPAGFTKTSTGYTITNTEMQIWANQSNIEFVYQKEWESQRCEVSSISGTTITMKQSCFNNAQLHSSIAIGNPLWIENAYELLDEEGEWYLNSNPTSGYLYYKPRPGENMNSVSVIAPTVETLVNGTGTLDAPVHNIQFYGLTFAYSTWLFPNGDDGYNAIQAGFRVNGTNNGNLPRGDAWLKTPASLSFTTAKSIRFERNRFLHLGSAGLGFEYGSQDNSIIGNLFSEYRVVGLRLEI